MNFNGTARQVWVFINEDDHWEGQPLYLALLETLKHNGCSGATVLRGIASYGIHSLIHTTTLVEVSSHLPVVVTFVDRADRVAHLLPEIRRMVPEGLITITPIEVIQASHRAVGPFPPHLTVAEVMTRDVAWVTPATPVAQAVALLIERELTALPILDHRQRVVGMITDGDLLTRGCSELPVDLQRELPPEDRAVYVDNLINHPRSAADLMTPEPITLPATSTLARAAAIMVETNLKRLPVVDDQERLVGIVSYADLLRTVADVVTGKPAANIADVAGSATTVGAIVLRDIPSVHRDTPLTEALDRLLLTEERRVVVIDDRNRPVGIITDGDVMRRAAHKVEPGTLRRLAAWFGGGTRPVELGIEAHGRTAATVMTSPVLTITPDESITEAVRRMMSHHVKRLPVVDADGCLVGLVGRAEALAALCRPTLAAPEEFDDGPVI